MKNDVVVRDAYVFIGKLGDEERGVTSVIMLGIRFVIPPSIKPDVPRVWSSICCFIRRRRDDGVTFQRHTSHHMRGYLLRNYGPLNFNEKLKN